MKRTVYFLGFISLLAGEACYHSTELDNSPQLAFQLRFDPSQERLNNFGEPAVIPAGHATQSPFMRSMGINYIELAPDSVTLLGKGSIVYQGKEVETGGSKAIDFENSPQVSQDQIYTKVALSEIPPGRYEWIRVSVAYQNYDIKFNLKDIQGVGDLMQQSGTVASFVGYNTYIKNVVPRTKTLTVGGNRPQGFWVFETDMSQPYAPYNRIFFGQAPAGATTVVNPLFNTSPIPAGSCVVTGKLTTPLVITGKETTDQIMILSFSTNKSLEWVDDNGNGQLDFYGTAGTPNERIVDMGIRGLKVFPSR